MGDIHELDNNSSSIASSTPATSIMGDSEKLGHSSSSIASSTPPTPVIVDLEEHSPGYDAPAAQKWLVVFTTSFLTLTACFSSTSLLAAADQIAEEFGTQANTINYSSAGLLFAMGLSSFVWGPIIPLCGRLYAWNACIIALLGWTLAASFAPNVETFILFRVLSGFQGTFFHVTGQAIIAEYFPPVRRGAATGLFLCGPVLGPPLGPLVAGVITTYTTWRVVLWVQTGMVALGLILSLIFLRKGGKAATLKHPSIRDLLHIWNPIRIISLMRYPNLLLTNVACALVSWSGYALLSSPGHLLRTQYNLNSPTLVGLFYLSPAGGFLAGSVLGGFSSDRSVKLWIEQRGGIRLPQDRLRSGFLSWFVIIPVASLLFGWGLDRHVGGLALPIVAAYFASAALLEAFAGLATYCAEVMPLNRQEAIASKYILQYTGSALATTFTGPIVDTIGVGLQSSISAFLGCMAGGLCVLVALFGVNMQDWVHRRWPAEAVVQRKEDDRGDGASSDHVEPVLEKKFQLSLNAALPCPPRRALLLV
ncbi:MFS transporter like protein [Zymoseptoria brevis]|uniref:MFS transporter like protein n=1 Tax=Zymoseptoria brevis TaxID=1047168 RepID=A0A0F4GQS0_9PEZI|nr:MFS transporter like protein [Zymoseptoria brevis]